MSLLVDNLRLTTLVRLLPPPGSSHVRGQEFESPHLHHFKACIHGLFSFLGFRHVAAVHTILHTIPSFEVNVASDRPRARPPDEPMAARGRIAPERGGPSRARASPPPPLPGCRRPGLRAKEVALCRRP
jgi:hypothetical protein